MKFNLIVAACENLGIGIKGDLPWKLRSELKYFSRMTKKIENTNKQNVVIMGRKTYFGVPESKRPLPDRINIILSRNPKPEDYPSNVILCTSLDEAIKRLEELELKNTIENVWIVGGSSVYKEAMESEYCHRLYFTKIKAKFDCDTFFPKIPDTFKRIENDDDVPKEIQEENGIQYEYQIYEKQY